MSTPTERSKAQKFHTIARVVMSIEAQQMDHPGYQDEILQSLVDSELRNLECEMGITLDAIAEGNHDGSH